MPRCYIDHIIVTAASLEEGAQYVVQTLGVQPQPGGRHERMGTHNMLLRLGDSVYLEVIAPDPTASRPAPVRPRWFALDNPTATVTPRLATWVARTSSMQETLAAAPEPLGEPQQMSRDTLRWLIAIPPDGGLSLGGVAPAIIEWQVPGHPASTMQDMGCSLVQLTLFHPEPDRIAALLNRLQIQGPVQASMLPGLDHPFLVATISTPQGIRTIGAVRAPSPASPSDAGEGATGAYGS